MVRDVPAFCSGVLILVLVTLLPSSILSAQESQFPRVKPTPPDRAAGSFRSSEGFRVELLAAEPLVRDPVVLKYDADGRAYVAEMFDYPYTDTKFDQAWSDQQSPPRGRIRVLTDEDGDGLFDHSVVFADQISWPTGIAFWRGGVYVAATPDLWYFRDTDGDLRADERRRVFTGFRKYNVQAVMNNLQWGLDHYIYGAGGGNGGTITAPGRSDIKPVVLGRNDFRFDPRTERLEVLPGGARFGNTFNAWGERFICNIRNPLRHCRLPADAVARQRAFPPALAVVDAAPAGDALEVFRASPAEAWRIANARRLAADRHRYSPRSEMHATGFVTSSSGVTIYRGGAYPARYHGNAFVGEAAGNLVMRYRLEQQALSFAAEHVVSDQRQEFLASTDNWHRPVNFVNAPDGMLHLVDMYRETIEHPWSIPDDIKAQLDLLSGRDRGRIYRLVPPEFAAGYQPPAVPSLSAATTERLVGLLASPHGWWRETARRLLWERRDDAAPRMLKNLLRSAQRPLTRLDALWTLEGLEALDIADLQAVADSREPRLRRQVVRLAARHTQSDAAFRDLIRSALDDDDVRVRFEAVLALASPLSDTEVASLAQVAERDGGDPAMRAAIVGSAARQELELLRELTERLILEGEARLRDPAAVAAVITELIERLARNAEGRWQAASQVVRTFREAGDDPLDSDWGWAWGVLLREGLGKELPAEVKPEWRSAREWLEELARLAPRVAEDSARSPAVRVGAIRMLAFDRRPAVRDVLLGCLEPDQILDVQTAALGSLAKQTSDLPQVVLPRIESWSTRVRQEVILVLLSRADWTVALLEEVESGRMRVESIPLRFRSRLRTSRDPRIVRLAEAVLGKPIPTDRAQVIAKYKPALRLSGDRVRGREVYRRECRSCHRLKGDGVFVGPDLESVRHRSAVELLTHILDPDREVAPEYQRYAVRTKAGTMHAGVLREETPGAVTLVDADDRRVVVRRSEIEAMRVDRHSLMPNGLEEKIDLQQMADLLEYILK